MTDIRPRSEQLHQIVRQRILTGDLKPGDVLNEPELAAEYGVSRTPARETLRMLVTDGWLDVLPRKGYVITAVTLQDVRDVMDLRLIVEPPLAAAAAKRATPAQVEHLRSLVGDQDRTSGDLAALLALADALHLGIADVSGNRRAVAMLRPLVDEISRLHYLDPHMREHITSPAELRAHQQIVEHIANHEEQAAAETMREHLIEARATMFQAF